MSGARRIIIGCSGSPGSLQALRLAASLACAVCPVMAVPPPALDQAAGHGLRGWAFRPRALDVDHLTRKPA